MVTNKIIDIIITITAWVVLPVQIVTTFVLGILVNLTFGLLLLPFSLMWMVLFFGPLLGLSYVWERIPFARLFISAVGVPLAVLGDIFVCLIPSMGEIESRVVKLLYCQTFPFTWRFHEFRSGNLNIDSGRWFPLNEVLQRASKDVAIHQYLNTLYKQHGLHKP